MTHLKEALRLSNHIQHPGTRGDIYYVTIIISSICLPDPEGLNVLLNHYIRSVRLTCPQREVGLLL